MSTSTTKPTSEPTSPSAQRYLLILITAVVTAVVLEIRYPERPSIWALGLVAGAVLGVPVAWVWLGVAARMRR
jgi:hypothetical protein